MRKVSTALAFAILVVAAGCNGSGSQPPDMPVPVSPAASKMSLRPHAHYEFWFQNHDKTSKLHMWNTYGGKCTFNQIPRLDLAPGASWSDTLHTDSSNLCAIDSAVQDMIVWFGDDKRGTDNYMELEYFKRPGSDSWHVIKIGGGGGFQPAFQEAPVVTQCERNQNGLIVCSVGKNH